MMSKFDHPIDPRTHAFRADLADKRLAGLVEAERFVEGDEAHVHQDRVPLFNVPSYDAELMTEALYGEGLRIFEISDGWAWGQLLIDDYVGFMPLEALSPGFMPPSHKISSLRSFVYSEANIKSPPLELLSMMSQFTAHESGGDFLRLEGGGFVTRSHVSVVDEFEADFVEVAKRFIGSPYLWGGRTSIGLDCSALVQLSLMATGFICRRDSDLQQQSLGEAVDLAGDFSQLRRGDIVFWRGHVGIMIDGVHLLHANAHHMEVAVEPLASALERIIANGYGEITAVKRLPGYQFSNFS